MSHTISNAEVSQLLEELAAVLEALGDNHFKIRAYKNAAEVVEFLDEPLINIWQRGELEKVKGIGKAIAEKLSDIFETGRSEEVERIKSRVPQAMFSLLPIEGIGPKKAYRLTTEFNLENPQTVMDDLKRLIADNAIANLEGFGQKSQMVIKRAIEAYSPNQERRMRLDQADAIAQEIMSYIKQSPAIKEVSALGSLRRRKATIGDIDLGVSTDQPAAVAEHVQAYPAIKQLIAAGPELVRFVHLGGENVDVKILNPRMWGSLLQHFTGSKQHNVSLRERALKMGLSLSEHGIKQGTSSSVSLDTYESEEDFYKALKIDWIPPELREDSNEIALAETNKLPHLVSLADIKGEFHTHTSYEWKSSHDYGADSPEAMTEKAIELGYQYLGLGDHNPSVSSYTPDELTKVVEARCQTLNKLAQKYVTHIKVLKSLEVDILPNGDLALPKELCDQFDLLVISIHSSFSQDRQTMTDRLLQAMTYPQVKIIGHPTGRLINKRPGYELNWNEIFEECVSRNIALEINANPLRLDINDSVARQAIQAGVKLVINTDAHAKEQLANMRYGVDVARRGWAQPSDIVNAWSLSDLETWLET